MDILSKITAPISEDYEKFKSCFASLFFSDDENTSELLDHVNSVGGKQLRPIFVLLTAKCFGPVSDRIIHLAAALEMLHTSSLVHDDVVDDSDLRRGKPSLNSLFDNKASVLLGDFLVAQALLEMSKTGNMENVKCLAELASTLSSGEITQLFSLTDCSLDEKQYFEIIEKKTAYLFSICGRTAALTSGASAEEVARFAEIGRLAGLCFQLKDDIFDYYESQELGKPYGSDLREGRFTLPSIYALSHSAIDWSDTISSLKSGKGTQEQITSVMRYSIENGGIAYAEEIMNAYKKQATDLLPASISSELREAFEAYLDLIVSRRK